MAKKKVAQRSLESLANEMYRLLIQCGMNLDGFGERDHYELRNDVAGIVREMDAYYTRKHKGGK